MSRRGGFGRGSRWLVLAAALMCSAAAASAKMLLIPTVSTNDPPIAVKDVVELLFPLRQSACQTKASATAKPDPTELRTLVSCMITERYGAPDSALNNPKSRSQNAVRDQLLALYADTGDVMAPGQPDNMDGENFYIRDGIICIPKDAVIPSGTWI